MNKILTKNLRIILPIFFLFVFQLANAQKTIKGKVTDNNGEGLIGTNIVLKGTTSGAVTDLNGDYAINATEGDILVFTYTGYSDQEITVGSEVVINVVLKEGSTLSEIVVTGYGTQKRSDVTGAISSLSSDDYEAQPIQFTRQALQGRTAGVQVSSTSGAPGNTGAIKIRGVNSISNSGSPLVVIDGVLGASLPSIHPSDIESIEVLKDASATALYGSRGANGVILVTTKRAEKKTVITASTNFTFQYLPKKIELLEADEFAEVMNINLGTQVFSDSAIGALRASGGTDWQDEVYKQGADAMIQNHHLSVSGTEGKIGYYISGNLIDNEGILTNSFYERKSLRANITAQATERLSVGLITQYSDELARNAFLGSNSIFTPAAAALLFAPSSDIFDENGDYIKTSGFGLATNPVGQAEGRSQDINTDNTTLNLNIGYKITDGLDYAFRLGNTQIQTTRGYFQNNDVSNATAQASVFSNRFNRFQHTHILTWQKELNDDHNVSLKGVYEETKENNFGSTAGAGDLTNITGFYYNLSFGTPQASAGQSNVGIKSALTRLDYTFKDMVLLTATFRADGSSKFLGDNKWGYFPSVALGYVPFANPLGPLSRLKVRGSWGQVGNEGISPFSTFSSLNTSAANNPSFDGQSLVGGIAPGALNNPDLKWETTTQFDVGFDAEFMEGRLNLSFDYFKKNTTDLLLARTLPPSFGPGSRLENVGEIENKGVELSLGGYIVRKKDFSWDVNFNISTAKTTLVDAGGQESITPFVPFRSSDALVQTIEVGEEVGIIRGYQTLGVWGTAEADAAAEFGAAPGDVKYEDINGDMMINSDDITVIGNGAADFIWGFNNTVEYKNFSLNIFFQSMVGHDILNWSRAMRIGASADGSLTDGDLVDAWTPDNQDTDVPALNSSFFQSKESSRFIEDGTFIRLKNISLSYNLPNDLLSGIGFDRLSLILSGQNVYTYTNYKGYDPEVNSGGASNTDVGFDTGVYPNPKSWTIGLNATF